MGWFIQKVLFVVVFLGFGVFLGPYVPAIVEGVSRRLETTSDLWESVAPVEDESEQSN